MPLKPGAGSNATVPSGRGVAVPPVTSVTATTARGPPGALSLSSTGTITGVPGAVATRSGVAVGASASMETVTVAVAVAPFGSATV